MKKIFLVLAFICIFGIVFAQYFNKVYNSADNKLIITVTEGWNLVPFGDGIYVSSPSTNPLAAFFWNPLENRYIGGAYNTQEGNSIPFKLNENSKYSFATSGSIWIYMTGNRDEISITYSGNALTGNTGKKIAKGWNFISITPWMAGKKVSEIFANCNITKANAWNGTVGMSGSWAHNNSTEYWNLVKNETQPIKESIVGITFVVKSENECELGATSISPPPEIPE